MKLMTYTQMGNELTRRLKSIVPGIQFQLAIDFNNKQMLKQTLNFPPDTTEQQKEDVLTEIDNFEGLFSQDNQ